MTAPLRSPAPGHDRARAVGVQLHVGARGGGERRPPPAGDPDRLVVGEIAVGRDQLDRAIKRLAHGDQPEDLTGRPSSPCTSVRRRSSTRSRSRRLGELVHVLLDRVKPAAPSARGSSRRLVVRVRERRLDVDVLDHVRAYGVHRRHLREETALAAAVSAAVEDASRPRRATRRRRAGARLELDDHPRGGGRGRQTPPRARRRASLAGRPRARARPRGPQWSRTWSRTRLEQRDDDSHVALEELGARATPARRREPGSSSRPSRSPCHSARIARGSIGAPCDDSVT